MIRTSMNNPLVRRFVTWIGPIIVSYVIRKITEKTATNSTNQGRKRVKNKAK
jgi:hypothetical protein